MEADTHVSSLEISTRYAVENCSVDIRNAAVWHSGSVQPHLWSVKRPPELDDERVADTREHAALCPHTHDVVHLTARRSTQRTADEPRLRATRL